MTPDERVRAILDLFPMSDDGTGHIADCGYTHEDPTCGCYELPERIGAALRDLLASERAKALRAYADVCETRERYLAERYKPSPLDGREKNVWGVAKYELRARARPRGAAVSEHADIHSVLCHSHNRPHPHGIACHSTCPTCGGETFSEVQP